MIDINYTLLVQLVNFIVLLVVLHFLLFRPVRRIMQEREQDISGAFGDAKVSQDRTQLLMERYNAQLAESKQKAAGAYNAIYQEGLDAQRDAISAERSKASELLDKARAEIASATTAARGDLRKEAEQLSRDIAAKLLGRAV